MNSIANLCVWVIIYLYVHLADSGTLLSNVRPIDQILSTQMAAECH